MKKILIVAAIFISLGGVAYAVQTDTSPNLTEQSAPPAQTQPVSPEQTPSEPAVSDTTPTASTPATEPIPSAPEIAPTAVESPAQDTTSVQETPVAQGISQETNHAGACSDQHGQIACP